MTIREIQRAREKLAREIKRLEDAAETLRLQDIQLAAMEEELRRRLHSSVHLGNTVNTGAQLTSKHKIAISAGRSDPEDAFLTHIRAVKPKGYSLRSLAAAIDVSPATMRAHRLTKDDENHRPIPAARAAKVRKLTGWPDDAEHWPAGLS